MTVPLKSKHSSNRGTIPELAMLAATFCAFFSGSVCGLTLPSSGYFVYSRPDGGIYCRTFSDTSSTRIVAKGRCPNINPKSQGGTIVYIEDIDSTSNQNGPLRHCRAVLTDPSGRTRRVVGGSAQVFQEMDEIYWTDRGDRFTFSYGTTMKSYIPFLQQDSFNILEAKAKALYKWGIMDTLGNFTQIPIPDLIPSKTPGVKMPPFYARLGAPVIRGDIVEFEMDAAAYLGLIDQDHIQSGIPFASMIVPWTNGCWTTLGPNGEAYAHHNPGHNSMDINSLTKTANGTLAAQSLFQYSVAYAPEQQAWGQK
jgi:hypothetical protein